jgi:hypothetical protein
MVLSRPFNRRIAQTLDANPAWQPNTRDDSTPCHRVIPQPPDVRNTRTAWSCSIAAASSIKARTTHCCASHYAALWRRQSGGFIDVAAEQAAE